MRVRRQPRRAGQLRDELHHRRRRRRVYIIFITPTVINTAGGITCSRTLRRDDAREHPNRSPRLVRYTTVS